MRVYDLAKVLRSKNAGPFTLTIDLIFDEEKTFNKVLTSPSFNKDNIAKLYNIPSEMVKIRPFKKVLAIKIIIPRLHASSGSLADRDVYGAQQHFPLGDLIIE